MKGSFHGLFSLSLVSAAISISIAVLFKASFMLGLAYVAFCIAGAGIVLRIFCAKCPSRSSCGHIIPGAIARALFPDIAANKFTIAEWLLLGAVMGALIIIPQYWLVRDMQFFIAYWLLFIIAGIEIKLTVCTACRNHYCPSNPKFMKSAS